VTNFDEVLESTLTWLLEAEDVLSMQGPVSDRVTTVKEQFQQHEVSVVRESRVELKFLLQAIINPLTPTVAIWVQLQNILCQTGLSCHL